MAAKPHAVILGAGVIGLTNAVFLAEAGYIVTIIAAHVPGDESLEYTSPWAGAQWRTHATVDEPELCDWDVQTFDYWTELLKDEAKDPSLPRSGVKMLDSIHYWDSDPTENLWWAPYVQDFRLIAIFQDPIASINKNQPAHAPEVTWGAACRAFSLDPAQYLVYLQERARKSGATLFQSRLPTDGSFEKALATADGIVKALGRPAADCFVNCTGLGAIDLCGDTAVFPVRGQTVLVKGEAHSIRTRFHNGASGITNATSYCITRPGSGTTILGGTKQKGDWSGVPDPETTRTILERCGWMVPELLTGSDGGFEVISSQAGLRPARHGGPRLEREVVGGRKVVHAYGHGGAGYQNSVGSARRVLGLVDSSIGTWKGERDGARL